MGNSQGMYRNSGKFFNGFYLIAAIHQSKKNWKLTPPVHLMQLKAIQIYTTKIPVQQK